MTAALVMLAGAASPDIATLATRLQNRDLYKTLDVPYGEDGETQTRRVKRIEREFKPSIDAGQVIKDGRAAINIYTQIGGDDDRVHKKLHVVDQDGKPKEITKLSRLIGALGTEKRAFIRFYFSDPADRDRAREQRGGIR